MQYLVLPPFIFGFLLTVFPRWMNQPPLVALALPARRRRIARRPGADARRDCSVPRRSCTPVRCSRSWRVAARPCASCRGSFGATRQNLARPLVRRRARRRFRRPGAYAAYLHVHDARLMFVAIKLGTFGLLLPIFVTVAHRMFPFFARGVVIGHAGWSPLPWLGAFWALVAIHLGLELRHAYAWLWLPDGALAALTGCLAVAQLAARRDAAAVARPVLVLCLAADRDRAVRGASRVVRGDRQLRAGPRARARVVHRLLRQPAGRDGHARDARPFRPAARARSARRIRVRRDPDASRCCVSRRSCVPAHPCCRRWPLRAGCWRSRRGRCAPRASICSRAPTASRVEAVLPFYAQIKTIHVAAVLLSGALFLTRGLLVLGGRSRLAMCGACSIRHLRYRYGAADRRADARRRSCLARRSPTTGCRSSSRLLVVYVVLGTLRAARARQRRGDAASALWPRSPSTRP